MWRLDRGKLRLPLWAWLTEDSIKEYLDREVQIETFGRSSIQIRILPRHSGSDNSLLASLINK
jgi:hypothetical protein